MAARTGCGLQSKLRRARGEAWHGEGRGGFPAARFIRWAGQTVTQRRQRATCGDEGAAGTVEAGRAARSPGVRPGGQAPGRRRPVARRARADPRKYHEPPQSRQNTGEDGATPGGYGGKPPGVAFIGVPTGARNAGRCSDGGPEHHVHVTTKPPLVRQDRIPRRCCFF